VARIGDEVLPARVPAGGWAYGQPAPEVFAFSRIEPQPDEGEHAAPVRDAVCPVQVAAMDVHLGRYPQKARQVEQAGGLRGILRAGNQVGPTRPSGRRRRAETPRLVMFTIVFGWALGY